MFEHFGTLDAPARLRALPPTALGPLDDEIRAFILRTVGATGGHLSANVATFELTIALHCVFDTPDDRIIWDVGHQAYAPKILTERREKMRSIRQCGGISGFPRRCKSSDDCFDGLVPVEEGCVMAGAESACLECLARQNLRAALLQLGLDAPDISRSIQQFTDDQPLGRPLPNGTSTHQASA